MTSKEMDNTLRLFISLDANNKRPLVDLQNKIILDNKNNSLLKPTAEENLHFTIAFLGQIENNKIIEDIKSKLNEVKFKPFNFHYKGLGVFPSLKFPRIIWVGVDESNKDKMNEIFINVKNKLTEIGIKLEDRCVYVPHLTIFRTNKIFEIEKMVNKYKNETFGSDMIDKLSLKKSQLSSEGPKYSTIHVVNAI